VVLAAEKKQKSVLYDDSTINKVCFFGYGKCDSLSVTCYVH